jgi:molybdopterin-dependent oxidoreductase alpha subunit
MMSNRRPLLAASSVSTEAARKEPTVSRTEKRIDRANWASLKPFGIGEQKPNNYLEVWRAFKENRDNAAYAWRILTQGTCDGCSLGTMGMRDWTMEEIHLCNTRLRLLRLNTMPALDVGLLADVTGLEGKRSAQLRNLGRIPYPMVRRRGEPGFTRAGWDEALDLIAARLRGISPGRLGFYLTSRGTPNENYYAAQKAVRAMGTNSIDNAARVCHSPSTFGLKGSVGVAATTCSYTDWIGSDLVVFIGSNVANNQPVAMKYLYHAKKAGTKVAMVNSYREPGMEKYWVPSNVESAIFGTKITDRFFLVNVGGDIAFLNGTLKIMLANGWVDHDFIANHTAGFDEVRAALDAQSFEELEAQAGVPRSEMEALARLLGEAQTAVLVWSMGITQHEFGEDNVRAIINLGLTKGFVGRDKCGLMPIRGHSGVQGGAEMGAYSTVLPGGLALNDEHAARFTELWGFKVEATRGLTAPEMLDAAHAGNLDVLVSSGGNFREVLPDPAYVDEAMARIPLRVHIDIVLSGQMLTDPADTVVLLPAATRYEMPGGVTETSTERRVIFSPEIPGPRIGEARPEWEIFVELAKRVRPDLAGLVGFDGTPGIRADIARSIPMYAGIQHLKSFGDQFQYGGPHLAFGWKFPTPDGKAHWSVVNLPRIDLPEGSFMVATRRGKQFNSMVHEQTDGLTGAEREAVLISRVDAERLGLAGGDPVVLRSDHGEFRGRAYVAPVAPGNLQVHWPEAEGLIDRRRRSPQAGIPDYNAVVTLEKAPAGEPAGV